MGLGAFAIFIFSINPAAAFHPVHPWTCSFHASAGSQASPSALHERRQAQVAQPEAASAHQHIRMTATTSSLQKQSCSLHSVSLPPAVAICKHIYLLLCTHGLEAEARKMVSQTLSDRTLKFGCVPRPTTFRGVNRGEAAVGQVLLGLDDAPLPAGAVRDLPGIIQVYAFVGAAAGIPNCKEDALPVLTTWVASLGLDLNRALNLTTFSSMGKSGHPRFRASLVRDGEHDFTSLEAMVAVGAGAVQATSWPVDLEFYDSELKAILHGDTITLGLSCAELDGERKKTTHPNRLPSEKRLWQVPECHRCMRFSTATLMLEFASVAPGETLLDVCGGVGTLALEAATRIPRLLAISGDASEDACKLACKNLDAALSLDLIAPGSSVQACCRRLEDWCNKRDINGVEYEYVDAVVSELPLGLLFKSMIKPRAILQVLAQILRPETGRAVLTVAPGFGAKLHEIMKTADAGIWFGRPVVREGNIGGVPVEFVLLRRGCYSPSFGHLSAPAEE